MKSLYVMDYYVCHWQACLETFFGLGLIVGPTLGGFLFQVGGYMLPFSVLGGLLILSSFLTYFLLPQCFYPDIPHGGIKSIPHSFRWHCVPNKSDSLISLHFFVFFWSFQFEIVDQKIRKYDDQVDLTDFTWIIIGFCGKSCRSFQSFRSLIPFMLCHFILLNNG